jgi:predicted DNA-binding protein YlxM (UPF0122 family)
MKKFLSYLFIAGVVSGFSADLSAMDSVNRLFRERYNRFMLGDELYTELNKECNRFVGQPRLRRRVVERTYRAPWLIQKASFLGDESLVSYAQAVYRDIQRFMEELQAELEKIKPGIFEINIGQAWRALDQPLDQIINESGRNVVEVTKQQIEQNINAVVELLQTFKQKLHTMVDVGKAAASARITNAENAIRELDHTIDRLSRLRTKKRLGWAERANLNALISRVEKYIDNQCR